MTSAVLQAPPAEDAGRQIERALQEAARALEEATQAPSPPANGAIAAPPAVIEALRAQIAAERQNIEQLTNRLVSGTTDAAESVITDQIEASQERLSDVQAQLDRALGVTAARVSTRSEPALPYPTDIPPGVKDVTEAFFVTVVLVAIGIPIARAFARRIDRRSAASVPAALPATLEPRLDRMEQAIEAIAIEVERVSEGQRFTNKLMSEARALPAPNPLEQWPLAGAKEAVPVERPGER
jgi:hypothetical protein